MKPSPRLELPICEPVELRPGACLRAERRRQGADSPRSKPFPHFHEVQELVLFGHVRGGFLAGGRRHVLKPGCIAFVPSMCRHDFELEAGARDWIIVQVDPVFGESCARKAGLKQFANPFSTNPDTLARRRLWTLAEWLVELGPEDAITRPLVELLYQAVVRSPPMAGAPLPPQGERGTRLNAAIDALRRDPAGGHALRQAASRCALSEAYFSRLFRSEMGLSWSDYVRTHRLRLASRQLLESDQGIADIAWAAGFNSPSQFAYLFRRRFGRSPREYRRGR